MQYDPVDQEIEPHKTALQEIARLLCIMARLRGPDGCPWDKAQTLQSLRPCLLEETYEVLEAIDDGDDTSHREELGDLLLQIVFQAELAREGGRWGMAEVASGISRKLLFRHPHVFGDVEANDAQAAYQSWEKVKAAEKKARGRPRGSVLDGVPLAAPALLRAERVGEKAAHTGFDWQHIGEVRRKLDEEIRELDKAMGAGDEDAIFDELGDVLLTLASLGRFLGIHAEDSLREAVRRFTERFGALEEDLASQQISAKDLDPDALEARWQAAKSRIEPRKNKNDDR